MILPDDLHPLPVSQDDSKRRVDDDAEGFVNESAVRHLLVGPLAVGGAPTCFRGEPGEFAGPVEESPFVSMSDDNFHGSEPAKPFGVSEKPSVRRAAPPRPRGGGGVEAVTASRPWILSAAMLLAGFSVGCVLFAFGNPMAPAPPAPVVPAVQQLPSLEEEGPAMASAHSSMP